MHLDPPLLHVYARLAALAAGLPPAAPDDLDAQRRGSNATMMLLAPPHDPSLLVDEHRVPVEGGEITVRLTRPKGLAEPAPLLVFLHGGGWFKGDIDTGEVECGPLASLVPCAVASVDYRLAPEHPYPIPLEDCLAAYLWLLDHASELGLDARRVALGGASAGGNLTAALCLLLRDRGLPLPIFQQLDAPALDLTPEGNKEDGGLANLTSEDLLRFAAYYLGADGDPRDPYVSPLHAPDLSGLPPAVLVVCEHDPVRAHGERYLARLHKAGVAAAAVRLLAHPHGGWMAPGTVSATLVHEMRAGVLRRAFAGTLIAPVPG
ncbi:MULTISPECIES: alpha/beta hydrolase [Nonomuraea]|uniref:Alpha/beta hydrolase fold domain-containing protein n=1 Tax=Nonomuraea mangrovi TaxID=2316207 RepID=A0ABW4T7R4_9ACTN